MCNNGTICTNCIGGYFLEANNTCTSCGTGCISCTNTSICSACFSGYYLIVTTQKCSSCSQNCISCSDSNTCSQCAEGYEVNDNSCRK